MKLRLALLAFSMLATPQAVKANYCPSPASRSNVTISGVVNTYYPVATDLINNGQITIGNPRGAAEDLRVGDLVVLWVHQFTQLNNTSNSSYGAGSGTAGKGWTALNNTGKFEWLRVAGVNGVTAANGTVVRTAAETGNVSITVTNGAGNGPFALLDLTVDSVRSAQVIRVPQYGNATINGTVTAAPYRQGASTGVAGPQSTGGIVILDVAGTLTFSPGAKIDVNGLGFRGGAGQRFDGRGSGSSQFAAAGAYSYSAVAAVPATYGGIKGEGAGGTPHRVIDQATNTLISGLNYSAITDESPDGYGEASTPGAYGRGAPANAGGGATDQCPYGVGNGDSDSMCRVNPNLSAPPLASATSQVTYYFNRLNTGGGGGAGWGDGGTGGGHDYDGSISAAVNPVGVQGGGIGGKGVSSTSFFTDPPIPAGFHQFAMMGGGGGAGSTNAASSASDATQGDLQSSGAAGGGVVIIRSGRVAGSGSITANGSDAFDVTATDPDYPAWDHDASAATAARTITGGAGQGNGGGGGGGGGWILVSAREASTPTLSLSARGGAGGDSSGGMGAGGGGGGGFIGVSTTISGASTNVSGGAGGFSSGVNTPITKGAAMTNASDNSVATGLAQAGDNGSTGTFAASGLSVPSENAPLGSRAASSSSVAPGAQCVPIVKKEFSTDGGNTWLSSITANLNQVFKMRVRIENGNQDSFFSGVTLPQNYDDLAFTDTYGANIVNAATPNVSHSGCGSPSITATPGDNKFTVGGNAAIPGETTCTITLDLRATAPGGPWTNTITAGSVSAVQLKQVAGANPLTLLNYEDVSASVTVPAGVTATKSSTVASDPVNGTTNPKRIPGAAVDYVIDITNSTGTALDNNTMVVSDVLAPETKLFVNNLPSMSLPFAFVPNSSNLTCGAGCISYSTMTNPDVTNDAHWQYTPVADGQGADANVKAIRFKTQGVMASGSSIAVGYRTIVK